MFQALEPPWRFWPFRKTGRPAWPPLLTFTSPPRTYFLLTGTRRHLNQLVEGELPQVWGSTWRPGLMARAKFIFCVPGRVFCSRRLALDPARLISNVVQRVRGTTSRKSFVCGSFQKHRSRPWIPPRQGHPLCATAPQSFQCVPPRSPPFQRATRFDRRGPPEWTAQPVCPLPSPSVYGPNEPNRAVAHFALST